MKWEMVGSLLVGEYLPMVQSMSVPLWMRSSCTTGNSQRKKYAKCIEVCYLEHSLYYPGILIMVFATRNPTKYIDLKFSKNTGRERLIRTRLIRSST